MYLLTDSAHYEPRVRKPPLACPDLGRLLASHRHPRTNFMKSAGDIFIVGRAYTDLYHPACRRERSPSVDYTNWLGSVSIGREKARYALYPSSEQRVVAGRGLATPCRRIVRGLSAYSSGWAERHGADDGSSRIVDRLENDGRYFASGPRSNTCASSGLKAALRVVPLVAACRFSNSTSTCAGSGCFSSNVTSTGELPALTARR